MKTIAKNTLANVLFVVILLCLAAGLLLIGVEPFVTALLVAIAAVAIKFDDHRIRRARQKI